MEKLDLNLKEFSKFVRKIHRYDWIVVKWVLTWSNNKNYSSFYNFLNSSYFSAEPARFILIRNFKTSQIIFNWIFLLQWSCCNSKLYLFYKFCLFGYCVSWLVWTTIKECLLLGRGAHAIMELSYWILVLITFHSLVASFSAFYHHVIRPRQVGWPGKRFRFLSLHEYVCFRSYTCRDHCIAFFGSGESKN